MNQSDCLIGFGANTGDCRQAFHHAIEMLGLAGFEQCRPSMLMRSRPIGGQAGDQEFLNSVVAAQWPSDSLAAFQALKRIERSLGRTGGPRWGPRAIDLDLLMHGDRVYADESLVLPHPRMCCRRFVLRPAAEVAGAWIHPVSRLSLGDLWSHLSDRPRQAIWITNRQEFARDEIGKNLHRMMQPSFVSTFHELASLESICPSNDEAEQLQIGWSCLITDKWPGTVGWQNEFRILIWHHEEWPTDSATFHQIQNHRGIKLDLAHAAIDTATEIQAALEGMS